MTRFDATILFVPGLRGHVADHWQTLLANEVPGSMTVPPLTENGMSLAARVANLEATLGTILGPVILVAHSAGCLITAKWAQTATRQIRGALLATPADVEMKLPDGYPQPDVLEAHGWRPVPRSPLFFPTIVAGSTNDPLAQEIKVQLFARAWGARYQCLGDVGHLNPGSGFGPWPQAIELIATLDTK